MRVLAVNAGSSSLKLRLLSPDDELLASHDLPPLAAADRGPLAEVMGQLPEIDAIGHRIVHGGERFREPVLIDAEVEAALRELTDLAPLHQPASLAALDVVSAALPDLPAVACFDTAFHATLPEPATTYALPAPWRERYGLRRFGFHGLAHAYAARRAAELAGAPEGSRRIVTCQLGAGASLAAVRDGISVDTTMGFTPLEGLVMATRSGSVDPGLLLWLLERPEIDEPEMAEKLEHGSGLLGLAGTADMAQVVADAEAGREEARLAFDVYSRRLRGGIAAMAAAMGGIELLAFSGGVGEHSAEVRAAAAGGLRFLGVEVDPELNGAARGDLDISSPSASARTLVISSREELEIARQVRGLLSAQA